MKNERGTAVMRGVYYALQAQLELYRTMAAIVRRESERATTDVDFAYYDGSSQFIAGMQEGMSSARDIVERCLKSLE